MEDKKSNCIFCSKPMKTKKCGCGASYIIDKTYGNFIVWRKELK